MAAKRRVDPERPKRPLTAYLRFLADFRQQKPEGLAGRDVIKAAAAEWKQLSLERRKPYEAAFEADRTTYKKQVQAYEASGKKEAFKRDPEMPKRPMSGFLRFVADRRKGNTDVKITEMTKMCGAEWKSMTEAQRKPYNDQYEVEKAHYQTEMEAYKASGKQEQWKARVGIKTKAELEAEKNAKKAEKDALAAKKKAAAEAKKAAALKKKEVAAAKKNAAAQPSLKA